MGAGKLSVKCWRAQVRGGGEGRTCNGLGSHPGGVALLLVAQCCGNWDSHGLFHSIVSSLFY